MKKTIQTWMNFLFIAGFVMILTTSCKKSESATDPTQTTNGTVKDIDGNSYTTVTIGSQVWMVENLKTTKYRNGDPIPNVTDNTQWSNLTTGAYCNYNNDVAIGNKHGKLYNWIVVNDSRKIAPIGWHVPSEAEWTKLTIYIGANLGTSGSIDKALASKTDWVNSTETGAVGNDLSKNNTSGFTALPGGHRGWDYLGQIKGAYLEVGYEGHWWLSDEEDEYGFSRGLKYNDSDWNVKGGDQLKEDGNSIRCIKD